MSETKIVKISDTSRIIHTGTGNVYSVAVNLGDDNWQNSLGTRKHNWEQQGVNVMGKKIVPYGDNNNLPVILRNIMDENHLAPGILARKLGLLYGDGPQLYKVVYKDGSLTRQYLDDGEIWKWLKKFDYRRCIQMGITEYLYTKGIFVRRYRNRGARIGKPGFITKVEVIPTVSARLGWPEGAEATLENVTEIYTGDFEHNCLQSGITTYPVYDPQQPLKHAVSMSYHCSYSFGRKFYPVPEYYGTLKWIQRSSDIPDILKYLTENGIITAFHIHTPSGYWEDKKVKLQDMFPSDNAAQIEKRLEDLKDETFRNMTNVLAGKRNAGKFIETVDFYDVDGNLCQWKIEPIDQKIKDFTEAQLKVSEMANSATTSGMGLHPSLSNIVVEGQLSSGSQVLYALKNYYTSETAIPEEVIFEALNEAISINFPGTVLKLGFYRDVIRKEEEVSPENRLTNVA